MATVRFTFDGGHTLTTTNADFPLSGDELLMATGQLFNSMIENGRPFSKVIDTDGKTHVMNVARINLVEEVLENGASD